MMNRLKAPAVMADVVTRMDACTRVFCNFQASLEDGKGGFNPGEVLLTLEQQVVSVATAAHRLRFLRELFSALEWVEMDPARSLTAVTDLAAMTRQACDWLATRLPSSTNEISNLSENIHRKVAFEFLEYLQLLLHRFTYEEKET